MELRIGFFLLRDTYLKTMGSLIETCIHRGTSVVLFYDDEAVSDAKLYQRVTSEKLHMFKTMGAEVVRVKAGDLKNLNSTAPIDVLVTHEGYYNLRNQMNDLSELRRKGIKIVSLSHFFEIAAQPISALASFDKTYYLSQYACDLHFRLQIPKGLVDVARSQKRHFYEIAGSPMFDQLKKIDQENAKSKLGIPYHQPVVLLFAPVLSMATPWRFYVWRESSQARRAKKAFADKQWSYLFDITVNPSFYDIAKALRNFCDRNGARLIIKSRFKQKDPAYLRELADHYFDGQGDEYFPVFNTYELISVADLCIGVMTMGLVDAVAQSKPAINIYLPPSIEYPKTNRSITKEKYDYLEAIADVSQNGPLTHRSISLLRRNEAIAWFNDHRIDDLPQDITSTLEYQKNILGFSSNSSSDRIFDSIAAIAT